MVAPRYQPLEADEVTLLASDDGASLVRLIAGDLAGHRGPGDTYTPITVAHATVAPGARLHLPWRRDFNALAYVLAGDGSAGSGGRPVTSGQLVRFGAGDALVLEAAPNATLEVLLLGGRPIREPVAAYGPFVMNTRAELQQAVDDFSAGRLGQIPAGGLTPYRGSY
jgi:hypothetical protein